MVVNATGSASAVRVVYASASVVIGRVRLAVVRGILHWAVFAMLVVNAGLVVFIVAFVVNGVAPVAMGLPRVVVVMLVFVVRAVLINVSVLAGRASLVVSCPVRVSVIRNNARAVRVVWTGACAAIGKVRRVIARMAWVVVSVMLPIVVHVVPVVPTNVLAVVGKV